ncbi:MAG: hypothetical protein AB7K37_11950 [Cyclobacteriaceae bacterium]
MNTTIQRLASNTKYYLAVPLLLAFCELAAQQALPEQIRIRQTMDGMADFNGVTRSDILYGIPVPEGTVQGDYYLDTKWNTGSLLIEGADKVIDGYQMKYDIKSQALEIKVSNGIKLLMANRVESLIWYDSLTNLPRAFVNASKYTEDGVKLSGLLEVLSDGKIPLLKLTYIWVKRPDYIPAFDVGSRDEKIYKKDRFYRANGFEVFEIKKKKDLPGIFGEAWPRIEEFIKVNNLNIKEEYGLAKVFDFYNKKLSPSKP